MMPRRQALQRSAVSYGSRFARFVLFIAVFAGVLLWLYAMLLMAGFQVPTVIF